MPALCIESQIPVFKGSSVISDSNVEVIFDIEKKSGFFLNNRRTELNR
jgi:hypothetical protein